jgi:superfamily II DNA helicase RecQ
MTEKPPSQLWQQAEAGLQKFWGYGQFRPLQGEIVTALLQRQDVLVMLPTGAGKSLCFQLPGWTHASGVAFSGADGKSGAGFEAAS